MAETISVLLSEEEVDKRIKEMAEQITKDYEGKNVHLICILKGSVFFTCELAKRINLRNTPELTFEVDDSIEYGMKIDNILKDLKK